MPSPLEDSVGLTLTEPAPLVVMSTENPETKVTISVVFAVRVKLPVLLAVLAYPLPAQLSK